MLTLYYKFNYSAPPESIRSPITCSHMLTERNMKPTVSLSRENSKKVHSNKTAMSSTMSRERQYYFVSRPKATMCCYTTLLFFILQVLFKFWSLCYSEVILNKQKHFWLAVTGYKNTPSTIYCILLMLSRDVPSWWHYDWNKAFQMLTFYLQYATISLLYCAFCSHHSDLLYDSWLSFAEFHCMWVLKVNEREIFFDAVTVFRHWGLAKYRVATTLTNLLVLSVILSSSLCFFHHQSSV